jgi:hypothetical protein
MPLFDYHFARKNACLVVECESEKSEWNAQLEAFNLTVYDVKKFNKEMKHVL